MNSRRLMGLTPKAKDHGLSIAGQARALQQKRAAHFRCGSIASDRHARDGPGMSASPPIATKSGASQRSVASCHNRTHAVQQTPLTRSLRGYLVRDSGWLVLRSMQDQSSATTGRQHWRVCGLWAVESHLQGNNEMRALPLAR